MQPSKHGRRAFLTAGACAGALVATDIRATPAASNAKSGMRIRLLGDGLAYALAQAHELRLSRDAGNRKVLFDFGPGAYHRLLQADVKPTEITDLFFTHLHYDHWLDYIRLLITRWDQGAGRIPELNVYGPEYLGRMTELLVGENGVFEHDLAARTELRSSQDVFVARGGTLPRRRPAPVVRKVRDGERIEFDGFSVTCAPCFTRSPFSSVLAIDSMLAATVSRTPAMPDRARPWRNWPPTATCSCTCAISSAAPRSAPNSTARNMGHLELARLGAGRPRAQPGRESRHRADGSARRARAADPRDVGDLCRESVLRRRPHGDPHGPPTPEKLV